MMKIQNNTWRAEIWNFSSSVQFDISRESIADEPDRELNTRGEIQYLRGYHVLFCLILLYEHLTNKKKPT